MSEEAEPEAAASVGPALRHGPDRWRHHRRAGDVVRRGMFEQFGRQVLHVVDRLCGGRRQRAGGRPAAPRRLLVRRLVVLVVLCGRVARSRVLRVLGWKVLLVVLLARLVVLRRCSVVLRRRVRVPQLVLGAVGAAPVVHRVSVPEVVGLHRLASPDGGHTAVAVYRDQGQLRQLAVRVFHLVRGCTDHRLLLSLRTPRVVSATRYRQIQRRVQVVAFLVHTLDDDHSQVVGTANWLAGVHDADSGLENLVFVVIVWL